jgi:hypothetical protein
MAGSLFAFRNNSFWSWNLSVPALGLLQEKLNSGLSFIINHLLPTRRG